jgi:hypothetical protein
MRCVSVWRTTTAVAEEPMRITYAKAGGWLALITLVIVIGTLFASMTTRIREAAVRIVDVHSHPTGPRVIDEQYPRSPLPLEGPHIINGP